MAGLKPLKKRRRVQVLIGASVALLIAVGLIGYGFRDGINLYRSPTQVSQRAPAPDEYFQLGGLVKDGSIVKRGGVAFDFVITDGAAEIPVTYIGRDPRPDLFKEGQGTIAKGWYRDGRFEAQSLLAKHDETYMPREVVDTLKDAGVYQDPNS
ncbi:MAG: cytochrome c maturation protein CcmE [Paracoccus sp. (in: a-proteobacteria)]|uniref:cytochrome c maturation protein CcmE n=1 Tax=unclassified Paracoccus (in: a-proteobacteria) TaxID=2688777 RepID=UPI000C556352|nr:MULTISPECIES: cytochrome c maturation protein CcmE [unclassified Paracoccus (in: a-proteobacteria)]MAN57137.1 cytochrome c biogenesis protein CcmE [Paracoccus sp. (in: a-proteobacteria)]MBA50254.1 cytochrome c biogenesis protein CcmE [Paracoccus sp. (in: a-proteobacteria)]HIC67062.1 cytochrome c maturation protein CcmE [Paracoccus sp. (in: a-proteobacteria)]|tara:strand:- start:261 stop:719 length:459 start_codon:yes stop_codon:yes gene_type:complete